MSGWVPMQSEWWATVRATIPKPWPKEAACMDLRWHADRAKPREGWAPVVFPGRERLSNEWGWSDWNVRTLLRNESAWSDAPAASNSPPAALQRPSSPPPAAATANAENEPESSSPPPEVLQPASSSPPCARSSSPNTQHPHPAHSEETQNVPPGDPGSLTESAPASTGGPRLPDWVPAAKACHPFTRIDVLQAVVRCVEVARGRPPNPDRCGTDAGPILALWRKLGRPMPSEFAAEFATVAEWAQLSRDPAAARDIRAEGWDGGKDRCHDVATLARQDRWGSRFEAARAWEEAGRVEARPSTSAPAPAPKLSPAEQRRRETLEALERAQANLKNQAAGGHRALA